MVYVNGIYQRPTTNYTVSGTALTFTASLENTDEIDVHHMSIRSTVSHVADGSVTSAKLDDNIAITGNLTVNGTTTTINSTTVSVDDKNMELAATASPSDSTADGGGITLKGTTDKTIVWENDTNQWNVNQKWTENAGSSFAHRPFTASLILS